MLRIFSRVRRTRTTPIYSIGAVSRLTGIPVWALRWIERHDVVSPGRSEGRHRLFSEQDIELLHQVRDLLEEGVNLPGVRVILRMRMEIRTKDR